MLTLSHDIRIGAGLKERLHRVSSVYISCDTHALAGRAMIRLAAMEKNQGLGEEHRLQAGQPIAISLGYDKVLRREFSGFVTGLESRGDALELHAMDHMYRYLQPIKAKNYLRNEGPHRFSALIKDLGDEIGMNEYHIQEELAGLSYAVFHRPASTAADVLRRWRSDFAVRIYMQGEKLYVTAPHKPEVAHQIPIRYDLSRNVLNSTLHYRSAAAHPLRIHLRGDHPTEAAPEVVIPATTNTKGAQKTEEIIQLERTGIESKEVLKRIGMHLQSETRYSGYSGYLETWLTPYCRCGDWAELQDARYVERSGVFYIEKVETFFSDTGGRRRVYLGAER